MQSRAVVLIGLLDGFSMIVGIRHYYNVSST
jgi:hypothetical protein